MKRFISLFIILTGLAALSAMPVDEISSSRVLQAQLQRMGCPHARVSHQETLFHQETALARAYELDSGGYVVVSGDDILPPVIAYSIHDSFGPSEDNLLADLIRADLASRLQAHHQGLYSEDHQAVWQNLLGSASVRDFQQWPPDGYSTTGGWCKTLWNQTAPYNNLCPMDPVTNQRSIAGCPAVAIGQIVNYHETLNGTVFSDADDYHHNYSGRNYWIDDDAASLSFPSFPQLNTYLASLQHNWNYQQDQLATDRAALIFACGVAAEQVYSSQASGTFAVSQAYAAIQRFGFSGSQLITDPESNYRDLMAQNMMNAQPALLAVVTPAWDAGHNVVVDGYNTDGFFHVNFGWGGSYNGWYQIPSGIPYNLTVLEGVVLDIQASQPLFNLPEEIVFSDNNHVQAELINISANPVEIEAIQIRPGAFNPDPYFLITLSHAPLPYILGVGQSLLIGINLVEGDDAPREIITLDLAVIHATGVHHIPIRVDTTFLSPNADEHIPPLQSIRLGPNPFQNRLTIRTEGEIPSQACVYDLRGRKLQELSIEPASPTQASFMWDGRDMAGHSCPAGVYLVRVKSGSGCRVLKVLKL